MFSGVGKHDYIPEFRDRRWSYTPEVRKFHVVGEPVGTCNLL